MAAFVDANVIAKAFLVNPEQELCLSVLREEFVTDMVCLLEAKNAISRISGSREYASDSIRSVLKSNCVVVPVDSIILASCLKSYAHNTLDAFDSMHYTIALLNGCSEIVSYDKDFDNLTIKRTQP